MVIVGSTALQYWGIRKAKDLDIWCTADEASNYTGTDFATKPEAILRLVPKQESFATLDALYTIKLSHLGWDIFWWKHVNDALTLQAKGAKLLPTLFNALLDHWKEEHGNKDFLSLYKNKGEFFNDHVTYVYDHDYLHELVAFPNAPVYTKCLVEGQDVAIDYAKFRDELTFEEQVRMFREEITVIAIERWLVNPATCGKIDWMQAYLYALRKTVCYLTKNWASSFLVWNLKEFIRPDYSYFAHAINTLKEGKTLMAKKITSTEATDLIKKLVSAFNATAPRWPLDILDSDGDVQEAGLSELVDILDEIPGCDVLKAKGGGEYCYTIFSYEGVIYKFTYTYYSYEGREFCNWQDSIYIVEAKEKTVTVYE